MLIIPLTLLSIICTPYTGAHIQSGYLSIHPVYILGWGLDWRLLPLHFWESEGSLQMHDYLYFETRIHFSVGLLVEFTCFLGLAHVQSWSNSLLQWSSTTHKNNYPQLHTSAWWICSSAISRYVFELLYFVSPNKIPLHLKYLRKFSSGSNHEALVIITLHFIKGLIKI